MPLLAPNVGLDAVPYVYAVRDEVLGIQAHTSYYFSGRYPMTSIRVGGTQYALRRAVEGGVYPVGDGQHEFVVDALAPHIVGRGDTADAAVGDWRNKVHAAVQHLLAVRPFEMSESDIERWRAVESIIDISHYRRTAPIRMRQLGSVDYGMRSFPTAVRWADGRRDVVDLGSMPAGFAGLRPGQWIEAICERDPLTGLLLRITDIQPVSEVRLMSVEQQDGFLKSLPTGESLPESDLDWTQLD